MSSILERGGLLIYPPGPRWMAQAGRFLDARASETRTAPGGTIPAPPPPPPPAPAAPSPAPGTYREG